MTLSEGVAWSIIATQNLGILLWNNWLPGSISQFISFIGALIVAILIGVFMSYSDYGAGSVLGGGVLGGIIAWGILHAIYRSQAPEK